MSSGREVVDLRPSPLDILTYGADAWAVELKITGLGSLAGSEVAARCRPAGATTPTSLTVTMTDPEEGVVTVGHADGPITGPWDLTVTAPGGQARTYVKGVIRNEADPV
ncbi:MAG: hypothetical protein QM621_08670 [Aeromicrobium sp.]|uniref:hypothetical protein n=1 Tax=Aeromicrobium sp. TaxID=1871063 RepID=UPI0039E5A4DA